MDKTVQASFFINDVCCKTVHPATLPQCQRFFEQSQYQASVLHCPKEFKQSFKPRNPQMSQRLLLATLSLRSLKEKKVYALVRFIFKRREISCSRSSHHKFHVFVQARSGSLMWTNVDPLIGRETISGSTNVAKESYHLHFTILEMYSDSWNKDCGKSISLTEAEEEAVAREVHATHARIVSESEPKPTQRRQSGIAFRDSFIVSKKRSSDSTKKFKGSNEGTGKTYYVVPDESHPQSYTRASRVNGTGIQDKGHRSLIHLNQYLLHVKIIHSQLSPLHPPKNGIVKPQSHAEAESGEGMHHELDEYQCLCSTLNKDMLALAGPTLKHMQMSFLATNTLRILRLHDGKHMMKKMAYVHFCEHNPGLIVKENHVSCQLSYSNEREVFSCPLKLL
ncbi:hypothetical protein Tco_1327377 [Tanacetum coccineum]